MRAAYNRFGGITFWDDDGVESTIASLEEGTTASLRVRKWLAEGNELELFKEPAPTVDDVRAEAQRRIFALLGVTTINRCYEKQLNANMRANELNRIRHDREWSAEEQAEVDYLEWLAVKHKEIRDASNRFGEKIPENYKDDSFWPSLKRE